MGLIFFFGCVISFFIGVNVQIEVVFRGCQWIGGEWCECVWWVVGVIEIQYDLVLGIGCVCVQVVICWVIVVVVGVVIEDYKQWFFWFFDGFQLVGGVIVFEF